MAWGLWTPHIRRQVRQPWFFCPFSTAILCAAGCGVAMQYPQGKNGPTVDVNGDQAPGSPGSPWVANPCDATPLPVAVPWMPVMIEIYPPPTLGQTLACAKREVKASLETVEQTIREMAQNGESSHEITRLRCLLISAQDYINASENHLSTVLSTLTGVRP